ncbi:LPS translocon maturation chaperone LptM [Microbulbifer variabilis]|jgi:predicted small lipoprotein YifL|uniref:Lipoprotein n=1 Tax=Microbulbifer variabilis TaxID=266805 RepID=A0ABY4VFY3_9GAMM|nr:lipoprotein [Microbulbifer variabilis]USD21750.1 lipoprotein [Microbulbifer variabilis]
MPKKMLYPLCALLSASALLSGCGQKGPLYLPQAPAEPAPAITTGPPTTVPTSSTAVEPDEPVLVPAGETVVPEGYSEPNDYSEPGDYSTPEDYPEEGYPEEQAPQK